MAKPNWKNRTMWTGDNLDIMRGMNSESVDLIYLDPPFNSNEDYSAPVGSEAAGAAFKDTWTLSDVDEAWHGEIADKEPALYAIIDAAGLSHGKSMKSYLIMMAVWLLCNSVAYSARTEANFRHWRPPNAKGLAFARYASNYDNILYYGMGEKPHWNPPYGPYDPAYVDAKYRQIEPETGRFACSSCEARRNRMSSRPG